MGSFPTFDPAVFTKPMTQAQVNELCPRPRAGAADQPRDRRLLPDRIDLQDRSPPWRRSKAVWSPRRRRSSTAARSRSAARTSRTPAASPTGRSDLVSGAAGLLRRLLLHARPGRMWETDQLQDWARKLGIGKDRARPAGRDRRAGPEQEMARPALRRRQDRRPWSAGDNIQLAIGQGDLQTNPLQLAIAYAALGNGGTIVTPHVGMRSRGRRRPRAEGIRPAGAAPGPDRPRLPRRRSSRACTRRPRPRRHLLRRLRRLPGRGRGQDRDGGAPRPRRPVLVRGRSLRTRPRVSSPS